MPTVWNFVWTPHAPLFPRNYRKTPIFKGAKNKMSDKRRAAVADEKIMETAKHNLLQVARCGSKAQVRTWRNLLAAFQKAQADYDQFVCAMSPSAKIVLCLKPFECCKLEGRRYGQERVC